MEIKKLSYLRFSALAGYARSPNNAFIFEEIAWYATEDERILGLIVEDIQDADYGWVVLARDEIGRFRAIDCGASRQFETVARLVLNLRMKHHSSSLDIEFHQGDADRRRTDFFNLTVIPDKINLTFKLLYTGKKFSSARELISSMMPFYHDTDGNFIEQFQTTAFDARLWELYIFATFHELGYAAQPNTPVPDFIFHSPHGPIAIEATTANPPNGTNLTLPKNHKESIEYLENYIPIKIARALKRKLERNKAYWDSPVIKNMPFVIAFQDFHLTGSMKAVNHAAIEYIFGVRHILVDGKSKIERIDHHTWGPISEKSGFFNLPNSENISAIILNPQGTLTKFNRIGFIAGFGDQSIKMVRRGLARGEANEADPRPYSFVQEVDENYEENWVEGMVVLHNPNAKIPLSPHLIKGACHEFLQEDGSIQSLIPEFHPHFSETAILVPAENTSND